MIEGDDLWVDMMRDRCESERVQMMGSSLRFFEQMAQHLAGSPYRKAEAFARDSAARSRQRTPVSLIIPAERGVDAEVMDILAWAGMVQDGNLEVLVVAKRGTELGRLCKGEGRSAVLVMAEDDAGQDDLMNLGLAASGGSYITFARPGIKRPEHTPAEFAAAMMREGRTAMVVGAAPRDLAARDIAIRAPGTELLSLENLMVHRSFVDGGYRIKGAGTSLEASSCFAQLCRPELSVWRKGS